MTRRPKPQLSDFEGHPSYWEGLCLFCGKKLNGHVNEEHVVPRWLQRLARSTDRRVPIYADYRRSPPEMVEMHLSRFKVVTHKACNSRYGREIEDPTKPVMEKALAGETIDASEAVMLLDWLDKFRNTSASHVTALTQNPSNSARGFCADERVGLFDRAATFFRIDGAPTGINLFGPSLPGFQRTPSAIYLRVNDLGIVSFSDIDLLKDAFATPTFRPVPPKSLFRYEHSRPATFQIGGPTPILPGLRIAQSCRAWTAQVDLSIEQDWLSNPWPNVQYDEKGKGGLYVERGGSLQRAYGVDFSNLPRIPEHLAGATAGLEVVCWLIHFKELVAARFVGQENPFANDLGWNHSLAELRFDLQYFSMAVEMIRRNGPGPITIGFVGDDPDLPRKLGFV
jgi:hypothetical protein